MYQTILSDIERYCKTWGMRLKVNKTKIMIFVSGRHTKHEFILSNNRIEIVSSFKYLSIHLLKKNSWNRTTKPVAQHASKSLHNVFTVYNQLDLVTLQKVALFDSLVTHILNYGAEISGDVTKSCIV